jgi:hypothetical protein
MHLVTPTTYDADDTLTLIEEAPLEVLRRAYFRLGQLQWVEESLQKTLQKHLKQDDLWKEKMSDSEFRLRRIKDVSSQLRPLIRRKEAHGLP